MLSIIWEKRSIPLYWRLLDKKGSSNINEQQALIAPVLELLSDYEIIILGDREFGSVKLASWLCQKKMKFILRVKQGQYIQEENSDYIRLSDQGLLPKLFIYRM
jgi:Transposase DDE domain.